MKKLLRILRDAYMALLTYWTTSLPWCNLTPAEILMERMIRGNLPQVTEKLTPTWSYLQEFRRQDGEFKRRQKQDYDLRHRVRSLPPIPDETEVWITSEPQSIPGLATPAKAPRSYTVVTDSGKFAGIVPISMSSQRLQPPPIRLSQMNRLKGL